MTQIYLAFSSSGETRKTFQTFDWNRYKLNMLVSFAYLDEYRAFTPPCQPVRTMLDSGAYSVWASGKSIDIHDLMEETANGGWDEAVALDVIGDPEASLQNALYMKSLGSKAFPVFHVGDPWEVFEEYTRHFDKIGLACLSERGNKKAFWFLDQCFARCWPRKYHSFGWVSTEVLERYPFHTADTASWNNKPTRWGRWRAFKQLATPKGSGLMPLTPEIEYYLKLQHSLEQRWAREMKRLEQGVFY